MLEFLKVYEKRIADEKTDFRYVYFPNDIFFTSHYLSQNVELRKIFNTELNFNNAVFCEKVDFNATFKKGVSFDYAVFKKKVSFYSSTFEADVSFLYVDFNNKLYFVSTNIKENSNVYFSNAVFRENAKVWVQNSKIEGVIHFDQTVIEGFVILQSTENHGQFIRDNSRINLRYAHVQGNGRFIFDKVTLHPNWFIDTDGRKFVFTSPDWKNVFDNSTKQNVFRELKILSERGILNEKALFKITCRELAENAENNNRFDEASNFRRKAFETEWLEMSDDCNKWFDNIVKAKKKIEKDFGYKKVDLLLPLKKTLYIIRHFEFPHLFYRNLSYYGESWRRAFLWLVLICPIFALLFYLFGTFENKENNLLQTLGDYLSYSLQVMTLQRPEPKPLSFWTVLIYSLEIILTPIQLALLALAIRRKFMR